MKLIEDRRMLAAAGAGAAVLAGVVLAVVLTGGKDAPAPDGNNTAAAGLQVELGEQAKLDPDRVLRCFVGGQFIGEATLADCAKRNGVAAQSLDVGIDPNGALVASGAPAPPPAPPPAPAVSEPAAVETPVSECLRYGPEGWRATGGAVSLSACVQTLFAGHCAAPGEAVYGRWGAQSLRLVPGRVEASADNREFHALVDQARDCSIPSL